MMSEMARQPLAIAVICGQIRPRNWCGSTKMSSVAPSTACERFGSAITLSVNLMPCDEAARRGRREGRESESCWGGRAARAA